MFAVYQHQRQIAQTIPYCHRQRIAVTPETWAWIIPGSGIKTILEKIPQRKAFFPQ